MSDRFRISRRAFTAGAVALGIGRRAARAQGFAGLGKNAEGYAEVVPGKVFSFPDDHGPHPDYRIEWWYVTANLVDPTGAALGLPAAELLDATVPLADVWNDVAGIEEAAEDLSLMHGPGFAVP